MPAFSTSDHNCLADGSSHVVMRNQSINGPFHHLSAQAKNLPLNQVLLSPTRLRSSSPAVYSRSHHTTQTNRSYRTTFPADQLHRPIIRANLLGFVDRPTSPPIATTFGRIKPNACLPTRHNSTQLNPTGSWVGLS